MLFTSIDHVNAFSRILVVLKLIICFYNRSAVPADSPPDELKFCCGQLISKGSGLEHKHCDGKEEDYHVGGLVIELERCPHPNCSARFSMHPLKNLAHQDTMHRSIILYSCGACRIATSQREPLIVISFEAMVAWLGLKLT